jgi:FtsZ-binding cell division protein ZapB
MESTSKENNNNKINNFLILLVVLLAIFCGVLLWQYFELRNQNANKGSEIEVLNDERSELQSELEEMLDDFEMMETDNDSMRAELTNRKNEIEDLLAKVKDKDFAIYKLRKETKTLRTIMKGYVVTIDSLNTLNVGLRVENTEVKQRLSNERKTNRSLQEKNEGLSSKVALASRLKATNVRAFGVRVKRDMTGKETDRANRTDKIRVCFDVAENKITPSGNKNLFIRIIAPDGQILSKGLSDNFRFEFEGQKGVFSDKQSIDYANSSVEACLDYERESQEIDFLAGVYYITIYAEDYEIGNVQLELK